jgi:hypothetical protein
MPIMFGFANQRRQMLDAELARLVSEMPQLGMLRMWAIGDLAMGRVTTESTLDLVLVQETYEPWQRRADFWNVHLRPRVGTNFFVFTPDEFEDLGESDPLLMAAAMEGEPIYG